ncbi:hypothetical protein ACIQCF_07505 [Streptomyces sp. NPDC088353]|uniref:zinc finger domain-containing protein n=1 Tax=Streptomyces sp. NPDC088353 TaxID=3365855 RepID=UPI00381C6BDB
MTEDEVVIITRYVRAVCPQQRIDEYTSDAWYDYLAPYSVDETRTAIAAHIAKGNAFISIGEIVAQIRRARNDRLSRHTEAEPPHGDFGDASYKTALLDERKAIADGRTDPIVVPALPPGEQPAMYEGRGRALLHSVGREAVSRRPEFTAACPYCLAPPGQPCADGRGQRRRDAHPSRIEASRAMAAGEPPTDRHAAEQEIERRRAAARAHFDRLSDEDRAQLAEFEQRLRVEDDEQAATDEPEATAS